MRTSTIHVPIGRIALWLGILCLCAKPVYGEIIIDLDNGAVQCICSEGSGGSIDLTAEGTAGPFTFSWTGPGGFVSTDEDLINLMEEGTYAVTVTNAYACVTTLSAYVGECGGIDNLQYNVQDACEGDNSGAIQLTVNGGETPYSYAWSSGAIEEDISALEAGDYSVTVTDANGCTATASITVETLPALEISSNKTNTSCGESTGSIDLTVSGASPFTYQWSTGVSSQDLNNLSAGSYTVTVSDANDCEQVLPFAISDTDGPVISSNVTNESCSGTADGSIIITNNTGVDLAQINWDNGGNSATNSNLTAGTYCVTATDINGCTSDVCIEVEADAMLEVDGQPIYNCSGDDSIDLSTSGGTSPYTYEWSDEVSGASRSDLRPGSYTVTVSDAVGCTIEVSYEIAPDAPISLSSSINQTCLNASDGAIDLTVIGGNGPFSFEWSTGATSEDLLGLSNGVYAVTVTDSEGCTQELLDIDLESFEAAIIEVDKKDATCGEDNGSILLNPIGTEPFSYSWSGGETTSELTGLTAGNYQVTITDGRGCSQMNSYSIIEVEELRAFTSGLTSETCPGSNNGSISITTLGGVPPYSFSWSHGATTEDVENLAAGDYYVTITDASDCTITPSPFTVTSILENFSISLNPGIRCFNNIQKGEISVTVDGINPASASYSWSDDGPAIRNRSNLDLGFYTVTVTYANCERIASINLEPLPDIEIDAEIVNESCPGAGDGRIRLIPSGGVGDYRNYDWDKPGLNNVEESNLSAGTYCVTVYDDVLCWAENCFEVGVGNTNDEWPYLERVYMVSVIDGAQSTLYLGEWKTTVEGCIFFTGGMYSFPQTVYTAFENGTAELEIVATSNKKLEALQLNLPNLLTSFNASMEPDANRTTWTKRIAAADLTGLIEAGQVNQPIHFTGTDLYGNELLDLDQLSNNQQACVEIPRLDGDCNWLPTPLSGTDEVHLLERACGNINLQVFAENEIIKIVSEDGLSVIEEIINTEWTKDGEFLAERTNSVSYDSKGGEFCVEVTFPNDCIVELCTTICAPLDDWIDDVVTQIPSCANESNGSICIDPSAGEFQIIWIGNFPQTNESTPAYCRDNLEALAYQVQITDLVCNQTVTRTYDLRESLTPILSIDKTSSFHSCPGQSNGSICVGINGGKPPYTYLWDDNSTESCRENLSPDQCYSISVTDACGSMQVACLSIPAYTSLGEMTSTIEYACPGGQNGSIAVEVAGGQPPLSYTWLGAGVNLSNSPNASISNLEAGFYLVTVTDNCGETVNDVLMVAESADNIGISIDGFSTFSYCDAQGTEGSLDIEVNNQTNSPLEFSWNNGATTEDLVDVPAGSYTVTITNDFGCRLIETFEIELPAEVNLSVETQVTPPCSGNSNGAIDLTITGDNGPFVISWSNDSTQEDLENLTAGTYRVTVTDAGNCSVIREISLNYEEPNFNIFVNKIPACPNVNSGQISLTVSGGAPPYNFEWSSGSTSSTAINLPPGDHSVTITDSRGCVKSVTYFIPSSFLSVSADIQNTCTDKGAIDLSIASTASYEVQWSNDATTASIDNLTRGTYLVTVTNAYGCIETGQYTVQSGSGPIIILDDINSALEEGPPGNILATGDIQISPVGVAPFTYQWSNGETTEDIGGLQPGTYRVTVTDAAGCTTIASYDVPLCSFDNDFITVSAPPHQITHLSEPGGGAININVSGGVEPYTYSWSGPGGFSASTQDVSGLTLSGQYCVTITGQCTQVFLCQDMFSTCPDNGAVFLEAEEHCVKTEDPASKLIFNRLGSGASGYNPRSAHLRWSNGQSGLVNLSENGLVTNVVWGVREIDITEAGIYFVTVTDSYGCKTIGEAQFGEAYTSFYPIDRPVNELISGVGDIPINPVYEVFVCCTCGYIDRNAENPDFSNMPECRHSYHERLQYIPDPSLNPNAENVCQMGGTLRFADGSVCNAEGTGPSNSPLPDISIPPNYVSSYISDGDACGCLFPPGITDDFPANMNWAPEHNDGWVYLFAEYIGCPSDPIINVSVSVDIEGNCSCADCYLEALDNSECPTYALICVDENSERNGDPVHTIHDSEKTCSRVSGGNNCELVYYCESNPCYAYDVETIDCEEVNFYDPCPCVQPIVLYDDPDTNELDEYSDIITNPILNDQRLKTEEKSFSKAYPNPFANSFNVELYNPPVGKVALKVVSITGKLILERNFDILNQNYIFNIPFEASLPNGIYQVIIVDAEGNRNTHRVVRMKP